MTQMDDDTTDHTDFYAKPENQSVKGKGRRRAAAKPALSSHVPVRFTPELIGAVKRLSAHDGMSVSTWIRSVVAREVARRGEPRTETSYVPRRLEMHQPAAMTQSGDLAGV